MGPVQKNMLKWKVKGGGDDDNNGGKDPFHFAGMYEALPGHTKIAFAEGKSS